MTLRAVSVGRRTGGAAGERSESLAEGARARNARLRISLRYGPTPRLRRHCALARLRLSRTHHQRRRFAGREYAKMGSFFSDQERDALARAIAREVVNELEKRNATVPTPVEAAPPDAIVSVGPLIVDTLRHEVTVRGRVLDLKTREFAMLLVLARGAGRAFSREQLLDLAWPTDVALRTDDRTVDVHVRRVRAALGDDAKLLQTLHGVGYKLDDRG